MATPDQLVNIQVRNQVLLERLKEGEHKKFLPFLRKLEKKIRVRLSREGETIRNKQRLNALLSDLRLTQKTIYDDYLNQYTLDLVDISIDQSEFQGLALNKVVVDFESTIPAAEQVLTAVRVTPMSVTGLSTSPLLEPFTKSWSRGAINQVNTLIQQGFAQGKTVAEMSREIRGTKAANFNDGTMAKINRDNRTIVRTGVQHAASVSQQNTLAANDDLVLGYEWVSTLDSRTSDQCRNLDGQIFDLGKGPLPPIHPNCRSTTAPTLSEEFDFLKKGAKRAARGADGGQQAPASTTYYSWLKTQPAAFQTSAIGKARSKLLRDGGLTSEEFQQLNMGTNFEQLTLKEMKAKRPEVFETANI